MALFPLAPYERRIFSMSIHEALSLMKLSSPRCQAKGGRGEEGPFVVFGECRERVGTSGDRQEVFAVEAVIHAEHARNEVLFPERRTDGDLVLGSVHPVEARIVVHEAFAALRSGRVLGLLHGEETREVDVVLAEIAVELQHVLPRPVRRVVVGQLGAAVDLLPVTVLRP